LPPDKLEELRQILLPYKLASKSEVTVEANPEDVTLEKVDSWVRFGINRVSLGVQSFSQRGLAQGLGRTHSVSQTKGAIGLILKAGLSLSIDLIFGWSGQTPKDWEEDLLCATRCQASHISAYTLTPGPGTKLFLGLEEGFLNPLPEEETIAQLFLMTGEILSAEGFNRYEVSNFAKRGHECRHNLKYWKRVPYLGLGPAAHSFDGIKRYANLSDLTAWSLALDSGRTHRGFIEDITPDQAKLELLLLSLRLSEGLPANKVRDQDKLSELIAGGYLFRDGTRIIPSEKGFLAADYLARELA
jgi:oxygen-independent coproporphyrinogen-3 oxidase